MHIFERERNMRHLRLALGILGWHVGYSNKWSRVGDRYDPVCAKKDEGGSRWLNLLDNCDSTRVPGPSPNRSPIEEPQGRRIVGFVV